MVQCAPTSSYQLADSPTARTGDAKSSWLGTFQIGSATEEALVQKKLGVNGWGRWQYFRNHFSGPWGDGEERPFSPRSEEAFLRALQRLEFPAGVKPSVFLTDEGFLELSWKDGAGQPVQIEFGSRESEIYIESQSVERTVPNGELDTVIDTYFSH